MAEDSKVHHTDAEQTQERRRRVGDVLRGERLSRDLDLQDVAKDLRIRRAFLEAIENSRPQDLPGPTYALGFVRTYAEHLNLDAKALVDQYKIEADELEQQTHLHFPEPLPAKSLPGGALVFIGLLLLAIFYGIWWYLNNQGKSVTDLIPAVPEQFSDILEEGEAEPMVGTATTAPEPQSDPTATSVDTETAPATPETTASASVEPQASAEETTDSTTAAAIEAIEAIEGGTEEEGATEATAPAEAAPETEEAAVEPTETTVTADEPAQESGQDEAETAVTPSEEPTAVEAAAPQDDTQPSDEPAEEAAATEEEAPQAASATPAPQPQPGTNNKVFGEENADARVVITAKSTAWVEITGPTGERLLTRLMNKGDQYRVPNMDGVTLVTGNAGALEISIDGGAGKPLGPVGAVRRDVSLDPDVLRASQ